MGFPKIGDPKNSTLNSRILIIRTPTEGTPNFRKLPYWFPHVVLKTALLQVDCEADSRRPGRCSHPLLSGAFAKLAGAGGGGGVGEEVRVQNPKEILKVGSFGWGFLGFESSVS